MMDDTGSGIPAICSCYRFAVMRSGRFNVQDSSEHLLIQGESILLLIMKKDLITGITIKAEKEFCFRAKVKLEDGLMKTINWYQENMAYAQLL